MTKQQLIERLQDIEWDNFEVKKAENKLPQSCWDTVSAFANTSGGWLVLGVSQNSKKFEITGVTDLEKLEQDLGNTLRSKNKFNVVINPTFSKFDVDSKKVLACFIPSSDVKPVYYNSLQNTFIRTGSGDQRATEFEINALFRDQTFGTMSEKTVEGTSVKSLNKSSYNRFREYLKWRNPDLRYNQMSDEEFNRRLKIVKDGKLTYGGLLFLGKNEEITDTFSDFRIDYFEIPGTSYSDATVRYTYRIDEQENLWEYYFVLFQRLKIYANNPLTIGEMGIGHEDTKEIDALREALVNLLIHSDYFSIMKPRIRVFSNRIEFENPGSLPLPVEQLMKIDESLPRNPVLAKFFRIAKLCESGGYGFEKMLEWKKQTGNDVTFETSIGKTKFTFMIDTTKAIREEGGTIGGMIDDMVTAESGQKTHRKHTENAQKTHRKRTENAQKTENLVLQLLKENTTISRAQIATQLNITKSQVIYYIRVLKKQNLIRREGADKGGKWIMINS
jgi:ATP-dependent DNA helicase RecG